jgi:hydroxymethylpyrimidine pyrophosphatase-like HAD family hydrolase
MLVDYRQFAHGRHNWLDKRRHQTGIVAFINPIDERLANATLAQLPKTIPVWRCQATDTGAIGTIQQLLATFGFVSAGGRAVGIDPGRPGVPEYGSRLYRLGPKGFVRRAGGNIRFDVSAAVERKLSARRERGVADRAVVQEKCTDFLEHVVSASFGALVSDFDGTLLAIAQRNGPIAAPIRDVLVSMVQAQIPIFLATGRGDSIQELLKTIFPPTCWPLVHVGYLNGAFTLPLTDCERFTEFAKAAPDLQRFEQLADACPTVAALSGKMKGPQISFSCSGQDPQSVIACLQEHLARWNLPSLRLVFSSHSIDLLPEGVSKSVCLDRAIGIVAPPLKVLALGDCGCWMGNDYDLLAHPDSLSVDAVSGDLESCWNLLPRGLSHCEGAAHYLRMFQIGKSSFSFGN